MLFSRYLIAILVLALGTGPASSTRARAEAGTGLNFVIGDHGLESLSFDGQSLLSSPEAGEVQLHKSVSDDKSASPISMAKTGANELSFVFSWGHASCIYDQEGDKLGIRYEIANTSASCVSHLTSQLTNLTFPKAPLGNSLEAGPFGYGVSGRLGPLYRWPSIVDPRFTVPIIRIDYGTGALNFCSDDLSATLEIPDRPNTPNETTFPLLIHFPEIGAGKSETFTVSLRFGRSGASAEKLSADVLKNYATRYPFRVRWNDHRPLGAIYLASSGINISTNPRRWIMNSGRVDVTSERGKAAFRSALLKLADQSIGVLKSVNAQGMITWDPEGQEFLGATYYGDPRLVPTLAPEMEFKGNTEIPTIDEYFARFLAAGLKVGVCIRPQQISMVNGKPRQEEALGETAAEVLKDKIRYASKRWGCTLFYVDSNGNSHGILSPNVFEDVANAFPDVLLIPEVKSLRYFAYSAPFNSYVHHHVTSTSFGAHLAYPNCFSALLTTDGDRPEDHEALVTAVKKGDMLIFNGWYPNPGAEKVKKIYEEAAARKMLKG